MEIAPNQYSINISRSFCMYTIKHAKYCIEDFIALSNTTQVHEVSDPRNIQNYDKTNIDKLS